MTQFDELFAFLEPAADPVRDRAVIEHVGGRTLLVWCPTARPPPASLTSRPRPGCG